MSPRVGRTHPLQAVLVEGLHEVVDGDVVEGRRTGVRLTTAVGIHVHLRRVNGRDGEHGVLDEPHDGMTIGSLVEVRDRSQLHPDTVEEALLALTISRLDVLGHDDLRSTA